MRSLAVPTGMAKPTPSLPPEAEAMARVDADDLGAGVGQRAAGVARVDRGVGLDEAGQLADRRVDLTVEAAHDAGGDGLLEAERAADGDDRLAHLDAARARPAAAREVRRRLRRPRWPGPARAPADDPARQLLLVGRLHGHLVGALHHVVGGEDEALTVVDDAGAEAPSDLDLDDGRADLLDDVLHGTGGGAATVRARRGRGAGARRLFGSLLSRRVRTAAATMAITATTAAAMSHGRRRLRGGLTAGTSAVWTVVSSPPSPASAAGPSISSAALGRGSGSATGGLAGRWRQLRRGGFFFSFIPYVRR